MSIRIICINKVNGEHENLYVAISHLGWEEYGTTKTGKNTREEVYDFIKNDGGIAYVEDTKGNKAKVITAITVKGTKFLKTEADDVRTDNLLSLPECK